MAMIFWVVTCALLFFHGCSNKQQLNRFESDGCSLFPDRSLISEVQWCECCFEHDLAYFQGGSEEQRKAADDRLKACIADKAHNAALAELMYNGVRLGGSPYFPTWYRWGYGWSNMRGYRALTPSERRKVRNELQRFNAADGKGACQEV